MGRRWGVFVLVAVVMASCGGKSSSEAKLETGTVKKLVSFNPAAHENVESLTVADNGDVYLSQPFLGRVVRVRNGSTTVEQVGSVPVAQNDFGVLGLAIDGDDVLAGVQSKQSNGVWRFKRSGGAPTRLPGSEVIGFANDLALGDDGAIYVASSNEGKDASGAYLGAVWRIKDGKTEKWYSSPMLGGTGTSGLPAPIGANGIAARDGTVYIAVTEQGQIVRIPIEGNGSAGTPTVYAKDAQLGGVDGITFDDAGNLFASVIGQSSIVRVDKDDQAITSIAKDTDGLDYNSSVKFAKGKYDGDLLVVNFAIAELLGKKTVEGPALLRIPAA
jgi:sugar lactone lactonase YvrE